MKPGPLVGMVLAVERDLHDDGVIRSGGGIAVLGLDLGGTKLRAGIFERDGEMVEGTDTYVRIKGMPQEELLDTIVNTAGRLIDGYDGAVAAVGFGVPATIDQRTGSAVVACNLPLKNFAIRDEFERRVGVRTYIDNDANLAALAEQRIGGGEGARNIIMVTLGTGFGGGIIVDGKIVRGSVGAGAELGHICIDRNGPPCVAPNCPGIGCIETFCSGNALQRDTRAFAEAHPDSAIGHAVAGGELPGGELLVRLARAGDEDATAILKEMGRHLGLAILTLVNIFNPEKVILGGGLVASLDWVIPEAERIVREHGLPPGNTLVEIRPAALGEDAGVIGAAMLARMHMPGVVPTPR